MRPTSGILLLIAATVIALSLAEFSLRELAPVYTVGIQNSYEYDPELGVRLKKNVNLTRMTDHLEEIRTNQFGIADYRDDYSGYSALAFAIGDSYTQGTGLPADESYPFQLDRLTNHDSTGMFAKKIAVVNLGLGSYGGEQSLRTLTRFKKALGPPAYCLYLGSDNDFDDDLLFKSGSRHTQLVTGSPRWGALVRPLIWISSSQIVLRAKLALAAGRLNSLRAANEKQPAVQNSPGKSSPDPEGSRGVRMSVAELEWPVIQKIMNECAAGHATTVLSWAPLTSNASYEWLKSKSDSTGILFNDWYPAAMSVVRANPNTPLMNPHSGGHYRAWVAALIALGFKRGMERDARL